MELILIRHGLPQHVETQDGTPADPPLSEIGHTQAGQMATWLQHEAIDALFSSPMARAHQTAEPLARAQGLDIEIRDGVAEFDQHSDAYVPVEKLKQIDFERWQRLMRGDLDVDMGAFADAVITSFLGDLVMAASLWALWYHLLAGIRHLIWDNAVGLDLPTAYKLGYAVVGGSFVLTALSLVIIA